MAGQLLCGGKRLRPAFCVWGYVAAAGPRRRVPTSTAAAGRRGQSRRAARQRAGARRRDGLLGPAPGSTRPRTGSSRALHPTAGWLGDSVTFGKAGAILLGDLLVMWSVQMLQRPGSDQSALARRPADRRGDADRGDLRAVPRHRRPGPPAPAEGSGDRFGAADIELALDEANRVVEYKSARYTVLAARPRSGAILGGGDDQLYWTRSARTGPRSVGPSSSATTCSGSSATRS